MNAIVQNGFTVGDYRVEPEVGLLWGVDGVHHLCPRTIRLLEELTRNAGEVVGRQQIIDSVYDGNPDADRVLTRNIGSLRRHLGDTSREARYIETIAGVGYRLVAPVQHSGPAEAALLPKWTGPRPPKRTPRTHRVWSFLLELRERKVCRAALIYALTVWLAFQVAEIVFPALGLPEWALAFVVMVGILGFPIALVLAWTFEITPDGLVLDVPHAETDNKEHFGKSEFRTNIALLVVAGLISVQLVTASIDGIGGETKNGTTVIITPFQQAGSNRESEAFGLAVVEELRHLLRARFDYKVIVWNPSSGGFTNDFIDDADFLLQGSVYVGDETVRVNVQLVDPDNGYDLWTEIIEIPRGQSELQQQLAEEIIRVLPMESDGNGDPSEMVARTRDRDQYDPIPHIRSGF